jgi:hypothetical protein
MFDFVKIEVKECGVKHEKYEVYPEFLVKKSKDLMIRGKAFYAIWNDEDQIWSTDEGYVQSVVDEAIRQKVEELKNSESSYKLSVKGLYMGKFSSNKWCEWQKYVKSLPDNYHELDTNIIFANSNPKKTDYASKRLSYEMCPGSIDAYDEIMSTLYRDDERQKLEWAIGAIISGDSKRIQKFIVLKGAPGTGKSTFLNIVQKLFDGYYAFFDAKAVGSSNESFALEAFKTNPLIAIQHDGDLSRIEDNTKLNQIISHESLIVNEKFKSTYSSSFNSFLFMGTNTNVRISDAKSGIIRRLISVEPSGRIIPFRRYQSLMSQVEFELGAIAQHCYDVYCDLGENYYDKYIAYDMIGATNDFFNFVEEESYQFVDKNGNTTLKVAWAFYRQYAKDANFKYECTKRQFKNELKNYFERYTEKRGDKSGIYEGFIKEKFIGHTGDDPDPIPYRLSFSKQMSIFDDWAKDMQLPAQYAKEDETPEKRWDDVKTTIEDIDTHKLHYVRVPKNHIVIDFDLKDEHGNKSFEKNLEAADKWPATYAELSKSGAGIHLHYIYDGDVKQLADHYADDIEIKVFTGKSALRRKLTKCNKVPIATINSGLPLKERKNMLPSKQIENEKHLKNRIAQCLRKEPFKHTAPCVSLIKKNLDEVYESGMSYDLSEMENAVFEFAMHSTHQADRCMDLVDQMHFRSKDMEERIENDVTPTGGEVSKEKPIAFFDVEVFPNVFILCWKYQGEKANVTKMINPDKKQVAELFKNLRLIGFNNRDYDNHICWYYMESGIPELCYKVSHDMIAEKNKDVKKWCAYGLSYTDVYDFASNPNRMKLKKWEIKLGIHHLENEHPWDEPLDEKYWDEVAEYCANDVIATEAVFNHIQGDYMARLILAKLSGFTPNDKTNKHSQQIIFGDDQNPQREFIYTDLSKVFPGYVFDPMATKKKAKSTYKGYDVGEGGLAWSKPGMYRHVVTFDVASMHPSSLIAMNMFGNKYTKRFKELKDARIAIKHEDREALKSLLDGQLVEFYDDACREDSEFTLKDLANALKTVINSVYGLTAASFPNRCKDERNVDNIVAKRGALFMVDLLEKVTKEWGGEVIHIKTDSIKVVNPSPELSDKIIAYGKEWGYDFEIESKYDRICLIDKAQYIAKTEEGEWEPKGDAFLNPYIFKTMFSGEAVTIDDMAQIINAEKGSLYLDFNEDLPEGEHRYRFVGAISSFIPIKPGHGGGELQVLRDDKYSYPAGCTGWRWLETEYFKIAYTDAVVDMRYYAKLIEDTREAMSEFGDVDRFINDPDYDPQLDKLISVPEGVDEEVPFEEGSFMNKPVA